MKAKKFVYVLTQEHYESPASDSNMVAATPQQVYPGDETGRKVALVVACRAARDHMGKNRIGADSALLEVKEHGTGERGNEYRVWVATPEGKNPHLDRFVWVVRCVDFLG